MKSADKIKFVSVFLDSSYYPASKMGVAGYWALANTPRYDSSLPLEADIQIKVYKKTDTLQLEMESMIWTLDSIQKDFPAKPVKMYLDGQNALDFIAQRKGIDKSSKTTQSKKVADRHLEFFNRIDAIKPELIWIKGDLADHDLNTLSLFFGVVNKSVRKKMRSLIKNQTPGR